MTINKNFELSTQTSENLQVRIRNENFHILWIMSLIMRERRGLQLLLCRHINWDLLFRFFHFLLRLFSFILVLFLRLRICELCGGVWGFVGKFRNFSLSMWHLQAFSASSSSMLFLHSSLQMQAEYFHRIFFPVQLVINKTFRFIWQFFWIIYKKLSKA